MFNRASLRNVWRFVVPGLEPVTLQSRNLSNSTVATFVSYALPRAKQKPTDASEEPMDGVVVINLPTCLWQIWQESLDTVGAPNPKIGDLIVQTAGNVTWVVKGVTHN